MSRSGYPPGVPCWVDTLQPDREAAVAFYGGLFGWEFEDVAPPESPERYFIARLRGREVAAVGSQPEGAPPTSMWNTYIWVDNAADAARRAIDAGGQVIEEPFDVPGTAAGDRAGETGRMAVLVDPSGAVFNVWQARKHRGAELVNEPGTWNWSDLNTRDPEGAKAFYGAVFGWDASSVDFDDGKGGYAMWRLAGYGDFLEALDPGLRQRQANEGAPEGFADAIGWLVTMTSDEFSDDVPSHWAVTFAVDDADAIAHRAAELGGTSIVPPFDAGPTRVAVLSDPQGAVFSVSKYEPRR